MKLNYLLLAIALSFFSYSTRAQLSTETFEAESHRSTKFTDNGVIFSIISHTGTFAIQANYPGTGWNGWAIDNRYIDNSNSNVPSPSFSIKTTSSLFKVNRFWMYLSAANLALNVSGTLTLTGKLNGETKFTQTKTTGFATSTGSTNGYTLIDLTNFSGQNYSNIVIDELQITLGGQFRYACLDAFTWSMPLAVSAGAQTNVSCNGEADGSATVNVSGGTSPYTYRWSPSGGTAATASGLAAGVYTVTVKDANYTSETLSFTITEPSPVPAPAGNPTQSFHSGDHLGALAVSGQNIQWYASESDATNQVNPLPAGTLLADNTTYYATQTVNGCESKTSLAVLASCTFCSPLPVKLVRFTLEQTGADVLLRWETAGESHSSHFEVEHSKDAKNFTCLGTVAAHGTTELDQKYSYLHNSVPAGTAYYRLKQVDLDGSHEYFIIRSINIQDGKGVFIYPNPAFNHLIISNLDDRTSYEIWDMQGRVVKERKPVKGNSEVMDTSALPQGSYLLRFYRAGYIETRRLQVNK